MPDDLSAILAEMLAETGGSLTTPERLPRIEFCKARKT
jgi:hypothetical protein